MPLYRLMQNLAFEPAQIEAMAYAFESVCLKLKIRPNRHDALREKVAQKVIEYTQRGEHDPERLRDLVLAAINAIKE